MCRPTDSGTAQTLGESVCHLHSEMSAGRATYLGSYTTPVPPMVAPCCMNIYEGEQRDGSGDNLPLRADWLTLNRKLEILLARQLLSNISFDLQTLHSSSMKNEILISQSAQLECSRPWDWRTQSIWCEVLEIIVNNLKIHETLRIIIAIRIRLNCDLF